MNINNEDQTILLLCAFRYALGRRSYITRLVAEVLKNNWDEMAPHHEAIGQKITFAITHNDAGMIIDQRTWLSILVRIDKEAATRCEEVIQQREREYKMR